MPQKDEKKSRRRAWFLVWILLILCSFAATAYDVIYRYPTSPGPSEGRTARVEIPEGAGRETLTGLLKTNGLLSSPSRFALWLRLKGNMKYVKAGKFDLSDDMTPEQILRVISGRSSDKGTRVTIPEGYTLDKIASSLEKAGVLQKKQFTDFVFSRERVKAIGIPGSSAEGFLFPDTYYFTRNTSPEEIVTKMHNRFKDRWNELASDPGTDMLSIVTLASIVQAEAKDTSEMPTIAGVYFNRLNSPGFPSKLLQADPTVAYGCGPIPQKKAASCAGFDGKLRRTHLEDGSNAYNTYKHQGLPPGPICSPGLLAIKAALNPARVPYFYFVATKEGKHRFSTTLEQHNAAVEDYLKGQ